MNDTKLSSIILKTLDIIGYESNKEEFINNYLTNLQRQIELDLAQNQNQDKAMQTKVTSEKAFGDFIDSIMPTLDNEKKQKLLDYLANLKV